MKTLKIILVAVILSMIFLPVLSVHAGKIILENTTDRNIIITIMAWVDYYGGAKLYPKAGADISPGKIFETSGSDIGSATFIQWRYRDENDRQPTWSYREDEIHISLTFSTPILARTTVGRNVGL